MLNLLILVLSISEALNIACNWNKCNQITIGDGSCNIECMTPSCSFDAAFPELAHESLPGESDCYESCLKTNCTSILLGNRICDEICNNAYCGYDFGDCSYCGPSCQQDQLGGYCDFECNVPECYYDANNCKECSPGCTAAIWGNDVCNQECDNSACNFDNGDCLNSTCSPNCNTWMIGNGICDEACYTEECEYDKTDCYCVPNCFDWMLGDGVCDEACNNLICDFDDGDCGYCASGCTLKMLANDICDPACNTKECEWDYYHCGCAEGCSKDDYGNCKPECLVGSCNYDRMSPDPNSWCYYQELILFTVYQQMIMNDTNYVVSIEKCYLASNYECSLRKAIDPYNCYHECYIPECNYGSCNSTNYWNCLNYFPIDAWNICEFCTDIDKPFGEFCNQCFGTDSSCKNLNLFGLSLSFINEASLFTKFPHLSFYYASSILNENVPEDGSYLYPFQSISAAFRKIQTWNNVLYLFNDGIYIMGYGGVWTNFKILSFDGSKVTIKNDLWVYAWQVSKNFELENLIFDGKDDSYCQSSTYCSYCPYTAYNENDGYYYSDRNERIDGNLPLAICNWELNTPQASYALIYNLEDAPKTKIRNTKFINFRNELSSILSFIGNLKLFNVDFDNIHLNPFETGGIVSIIPSHVKPKFLYIGGKVSRLNNGYEFWDPLNFKGFLYAKNTTSVLIRNIEFTYNMIYQKKPTYFSQASLIYIESADFIEIGNCSFKYNYCETGIFNAQMNVLKYMQSLNGSHHMTYLEKDHIHIYDCKFISNYGNETLIRINFINYLLNVHMENLSFELNGAENNALVWIDNAFILDEYKVATVKQYRQPFGKNIMAIFGPRWCKFNNVNFTSNHGPGLLNATNMVNFELKNLNIDSNGSLNPDKDLNVLLLDYFIQNEDIYLKWRQQEPKILDCQFAVSILNSYNLNIVPLSMKNNICRNSSPTYKILNSGTHEIDSIECLSNRGNSIFAICFLFTGNYTRILINSTFEENENNNILGSGAVQVLDGSSLYVNNCTFINNIGNYGAAINQNSQNLSINSTIFDSNTSPNGFGGAIYSKANLRASKNLLYISSSIFRRNHAYYGGSIYITQQWSSPLNIEIDIEDSSFFKNSASYGSAIFIDDEVFLTDLSSIKLSKFEENYSIISGAISLHYNGGLLALKSCDFIRNSGKSSAVLYIGILNSTISLDSCSLLYNEGGSSILSDDQHKFSNIETKNCNFSYNKGSVFALNNNKLSDENSIFVQNSALSGSCLNLENSAIAISKLTLYLNNKSSKKGGAVKFFSKSQFYCSYCNFTSNLSQDGGAVYLDQDSHFSISNSIFYNNSCENDGAAIYIFSSSIESVLNYSQIYENISKNKGSIVAMSSKLLIIASKVYKNKGGIEQALSNLNIIDSQFYSQTCYQGCFIYSAMESSISIKNSTFSDGVATNSGGAIYSTSGNLTIDSSLFRQFSSHSIGGSIYSSYDSLVKIKKSSFSESYSAEGGGVIDSYQTSLSIEHSSFHSYSKTGIFGTSLKEVEILYSLFSNGNGISGGAIYCHTCSKIKIDSSIFVNNSALLYGGALYFDSNWGEASINTYSIERSSFVNNSARNGGGIYANNAALFIYLSDFTENQALTNESFIYAPVTEGKGGAIKVGCLDLPKCELEIKSCSFIENIASYNGGAINWDDWNPVLDDNLYQDNWAQYGNDLASYPAKLMIINESDRKLVDISQMSGIAPGKRNKNPLLVGLIDVTNQTITTDNISFAELKSENLSTIIAGATKIKASNGIFNFSEYVISDKPGSSIIIQIFSSAIDNNKNQKVSQPIYNQSLYINANLRHCEIGEVNSGKICEACGYGYYSLSLNSTKCLVCPNSEANCYGNYTISPKAGYWRDNMYTDKFWKCPNPSACLGSPNLNNLSFTGLCRAGYKGNMCQSCESNFAHSSHDTCNECPSTLRNVLILIALTVVLILLAFVLVKSARKSALKPKNHASIYFKIFLNYLQLSQLTSVFDLNWPNKIRQIYRIQSSTDYAYQQFWSLECLLQSSFSQSYTYMLSLLITAMIPFFMGLFAFLFWIFIKLKKKSFTTFWDDYISTFIVLLFLVHPSTVRKMLASFNCKEINPGEYWLVENLDIRCWDYDHMFSVMTISLPTIFIWGILFPSICLINLSRNRKILNNLRVRLRYGFLFNGYQNRLYYWEFIIMYSKVILICCSVFLVNISTKMQAIIAAILLTIFLQMQYSNNPYTDSGLNQAELRAKLVLVITIYSGLYYLMGSLNDSASIFFIAIIIASNSYFLIYLSYKIIKVIIDYLKKN